MTNDSEPDHSADDPATESELDAAIRKLDRLRRPESWTASTEPAAPEAATGEPAPDTVAPPTEPAPDHWSQPGALHQPASAEDSDDDLFAPVPARATEAEFAQERWRGEESEAPLAAESPSDLESPDSGESGRRASALSDFDADPSGDITADRPSESVAPGPGRLPQAGNLRSAHSETAESPQRTPADLPRRMFGLKRALDAHRLGVPIENLPQAETAPDEPAVQPEADVAERAPAPPQTQGEAAPQPEPGTKNWFGARLSPERGPPTEPESAASATDAAVTAGAAAAAASAAGAMPRAERKGWFGSRKSTQPEAQPAAEPVLPAAAAPIADALTAEAERRGWFVRRRESAPSERDPELKREEEPAKPPPSATSERADPFEAMQAAVGTPPKRERRGWFGRRTVSPEPDAAEVAPASREMVDLAPVREAMQAAALKRADLSTGDIGVLAAAAGVADEALGAKPAEAGSVGLLLVNLGTPDAPKPRAVRRYLREFLSDRRVIEKDTFVWQLVFRFIILPFRPRSKARAYRKIWNQERNESPLKTITRSQAEKLGEAFAATGIDTVVDWAMRYGNPSLESRIKALIAQGCERILLVPLYPQYSSATTGTVCDEAFRVLSHIRNQPALRVAPPYYADPIYIEAIASSIRGELPKLSFEPEVIVVSYHGMPKEYVDKGDPYYRQCARTTELLRERLGMSQSNCVMTFQSRFGRAEWLQPYTDQTLRKLAKDGVKNVVVVTPGFAADCLETLEEIAIENAHVFRKRGGKNFAFVPCLNDSERGMLVIRELATRELKGWV